MSEPHDAGSQESKQGMIIVGLIGLNALCVAVLAGASMLLPRPHGATPVATSESTPAASSLAAAAKEEPKAGETTPASDTKAAPSAAATAAPAAAAAEGSAGGQHAVVSTPAPKIRATLHTKPDTKGPTAAMLPPGTKIEVTNKQQIGKQTWYQVKTVDFQPASTGWLHSAVVKME